MDGCNDSAKIVSAINDRERRCHRQQQTTERRQRAATYIDENHDFRWKSEIGVSAGVFVSFVLLDLLNALMSLWHIVVFCWYCQRLKHK